MTSKAECEFVVEVIGPVQGGFIQVRVVTATDGSVRLATTPTSIEAALVAVNLRIPNTKLRVLLGEPWRFTEVLGPVQEGVQRDGPGSGGSAR